MFQIVFIFFFITLFLHCQSYFSTFHHHRPKQWIDISKRGIERKSCRSLGHRLSMSSKSSANRRRNKKKKPNREIRRIAAEPEIVSASSTVAFEDFNEDELDFEGTFDERKHGMNQNDKEWMFFDVAKINVKGGDGGDGCMAMRREFCVPLGGPSGGNGGPGGSVYLECDKTLNTLAMLRRRVHHRAKDGRNGYGDSQHGPRGKDVVIPVPPGTIVRDEYGALAGELNRHGQRLLVAKGGKGGRGNEHFKTARMNAPSFAEKGEKGAERWLNIELKLIADVGLVGVPNAGKSTLLSSCSNAKPKIADYPFTTVVPNLGVCDLGVSARAHDSGSLVLADIPGLLEGAHEGVGLGLAFLRHIQRCRVLIHVINGDSIDPVGDFQAINQELELFNPQLAEKTQVVVINKIDIPEVQAKLNETVRAVKQLAGHSRVIGISAATGYRVKELMQRVKTLVDKLPAQTALDLFTSEEERVSFDEELDDYFEILTDENYPGQFRVIGSRIEKVVETTNWDYYEAVQRFTRILEARGISKALQEAGAKQGDLVMIGDLDFNYWDPKNRWLANIGMEEVNPRVRLKIETDNFEY